MINFGTYAVMNADDTVNVSETVKKFKAELEKFVTNRESSDDAVNQAVDNVLIKHKGIRMNVDYVTSQVLQYLGANHNNYSTLQKRVKNFLNENSKGETSKYFVPGKGRSEYGVMFRADYNSALELARVAQTK